MPDLDLQGRKRLLKEFLDELLHTGGISGGVGLLGTTQEVIAAEAVGRAVEEPASIATQGTLSTSLAPSRGRHASPGA